ncbi:MAG: hypothetical protein JSS21_03220 [Proteobacteria bacterium]|nr:hypothetical protein [Pseudomonadota bacterium]
MYVIMVVALLFVSPCVCIVVETGIGHAAFSSDLALKWFVFWAAGVRLLLAGGRQSLQPAYTAHRILGLKTDEALVVVRELGFANLAIGAMGVASLWLPAWRTAAAAVGAIFYGLAGIQHVFQQRNRLEDVAMVTDLLAAVILAGLSVWSCVA